MQDSSSINIYIPREDRTITFQISRDFRKNIRDAFSGNWEAFNNLINHPSHAFILAFKASQFGIELANSEDNLNIFSALLLNFDHDTIINGTKNLPEATKTFIYTVLMLGAHLNCDLIKENLFESLINESEKTNSRTLFGTGLLLNNIQHHDPIYEPYVEEARIFLRQTIDESSTNDVNITSQNDILRILNDLSQNPSVENAKLFKEILDKCHPNILRNAEEITLKNIAQYVIKNNSTIKSTTYDGIYEILNEVSLKSNSRQDTWIFFYLEVLAYLNPKNNIASLIILTNLFQNLFLKKPERWAENKTNFCEVLAFLFAAETNRKELLENILISLNKEILEECIPLIALMITRNSEDITKANSMQISLALEYYLLNFNPQKKAGQDCTERLIRRYVSYSLMSFKCKLYVGNTLRIISLSPKEVQLRIIIEIFERLTREPSIQLDDKIITLCSLIQLDCKDHLQKYILENYKSLVETLPVYFFIVIFSNTNATLKKSQKDQKNVSDLTFTLIRKFLVSQNEPPATLISDIFKLQIFGYVGISMAQKNHRDSYVNIFTSLTDDEIRSANPNQISQYLNELLHPADLYNKDKGSISAIVKRLVELNIENTVLHSIISFPKGVINLNFLTQFLSEIRVLNDENRLKTALSTCDKYFDDFTRNTSLPRLVIPDSVEQLRNFFELFALHNPYAISIIIRSLMNSNRLNSVISPDIFKNLPEKSRDIIIAITVSNLLFSDTKNRVKIARKLFCEDLENLSLHKALLRVTIRIQSLFAYTAYSAEKKSKISQLNTLIDFIHDKDNIKSLEKKIIDFSIDKYRSFSNLTIYNILVSFTYLEEAQLLFEVLKKKKLLPKNHETITYELIDSCLKPAIMRGNSFFRKALILFNLIPEESISSEASSSSSSSSQSNGVLTFNQIIIEIIEEIIAFGGLSAIDEIMSFLNASYDDKPLEPSVVSRRILQVACAIGDKKVALEVVKIDNPESQELSERISIIEEHYNELEKKLCSEVESDDEAELDDEIKKPQNPCIKVLGILGSNLNYFRVTAPFNESVAPLSDCLKKLHKSLEVKFESSTAIPSANVESCLAAIDGFLNQSGVLTNPKNGLRDQKPLVKKLIEIVEALQETAISNKLI